jgi:hypothetical protein
MDRKAMEEKLPDRSQRLNNIDKDFKLSEKKYSFEREKQVVEILQKEHSNILKQTQAGVEANQSSAGPAVPHSTPTPPPTASGQGDIRVDILPQDEHEIVGLNGGVSSDKEMV